MSCQLSLAVISRHFDCCLVAAHSKSQEFLEMTRIHHFYSTLFKKNKTHHFLKKGNDKHIINFLPNIIAVKCPFFIVKIDLIDL